MKWIIGLVLTIVAVPAMSESLAVVNKGRDSVALVDVSSGDVKEIQVGYLPHEVAVAGSKIFVSNYGHQYVRSSSLLNRPGNSLTMIDIKTPDSAETLNLGFGRCAPHGVSVDPWNRFLYVTCEGQQEVAVIDVRSGLVEKKLRTNQPGSHMLVKDSKHLLYVTNFWTGTVSVIDTDSGDLIRQIFVGRSVEGIGLSPDEKWLFVTIVESGELVRVSTDNFDVQHRVSLGERTSPIRIDVTADGSEVIVNLTGKSAMGIYDAMTLELKAEVPVGQQPIGLAQSRLRQRAYVANMKDASVSVVDLKTRTVVKTLTLQNGSLPDGLTVIE